MHYILLCSEYLNYLTHSMKNKDLYLFSDILIYLLNLPIKG